MLCVGLLSDLPLLDGGGLVGLGVRPVSRVKALARSGFASMSFMRSSSRLDVGVGAASATGGANRILVAILATTQEES